MWLDRDLDFENQYAQLLPADTIKNMRRTITGRLPNDYAIGSAVLLLPVLLSLQHGLYVWHPITLAATIGWVWIHPKDKRLAILSAIGFAMQAYVIAAWRDWSQGDAFGGRMFISSLPILSLGLSAFLSRFAFPRAIKIISAGATVLLVWNAIFFAQYRLGYIPRGGPITLEQMTAGKIWMLRDLAQRGARFLAH